MLTVERHIHMESTKLQIAARTLLGLIFFVFGLNGFLGFIPQPPLEGEAAAFMGALVETGYMMPLVKGIEVLAGAALLAGVFVPLALILLAPIVVNIALFHVVLAPVNLVMVLVLFALGGYLAWTHKSSYAPLFKARPEALLRTRVRGAVTSRQVSRGAAA